MNHEKLPKNSCTLSKSHNHISNTLVGNSCQFSPFSHWPAFICRDVGWVPPPQWNLTKYNILNYCASSLASAEFLFHDPEVSPPTAKKSLRFIISLCIYVTRFVPLRSTVTRTRAVQKFTDSVEIAVVHVGLHLLQGVVTHWVITASCVTLSWLFWTNVRWCGCCCFSSFLVGASCVFSVKWLRPDCCAHFLEFRFCEIFSICWSERHQKHWSSRLSFPLFLGLLCLLS